MRKMKKNKMKKKKKWLVIVGKYFEEAGRSDG